VTRLCRRMQQEGGAAEATCLCTPEAAASSQPQHMLCSTLSTLRGSQTATNA
jgi:hypothetical protein